MATGMIGVPVRSAADTNPPRPKRCSLYRSAYRLPMPLKPSGNTPTSSPVLISRSASGWQATVAPALRASSLTTGMRNTRSAPSSRRCRSCGCSSRSATDSIIASSASVPEWLPTSRPPPVSGTFSMPYTSVRNQSRYSTRSIG
jgi:hypothetical protein